MIQIISHHGVSIKGILSSHLFHLRTGREELSQDKVRYLLKLAVQNGDITAQEASKVEGYTQSKRGNVVMALGVLRKHHGLSQERHDWLLANLGATNDLTFVELADDDAVIEAKAVQTPPPRPASGSTRVPQRPPQSGQVRRPPPGVQVKLTKKLRPKKDEKLPRQSIGNCDLKSLLGKGAMGAVYRGFHNGFDRDMAVKLLPAKRTKELRFVALFKKEAQALVRVLSPNVVRVFDVGEEDGQHYITMELVEGSDLREIIKREETIEPKVAAKYILEAARGLGAAHKEGLIHRDVKPDNLMITNGGLVKVADFGLAIDTDDGKTKGGLKKRSIVGTPYYMPPEQADGRPADRRADIYSLGCTLFHALTGDVPFRGKTLMDVLVQHVNKEPRDPASLNSKVDKDLSSVCLKMMEKELEDRFEDMDEVISVLEGYLKGEKQETISPRAASSKKVVLPLAERPAPVLPEAPAVRGFAISSSAVTTIVIVLLIVLNYPFVRALAVESLAVPSSDSLVLTQLEEDLTENLTDEKAFEQSMEIFNDSFPQLANAGAEVEERILALDVNRAKSAKSARAKFAAMVLAQPGLEKQKKFAEIYQRLYFFPKDALKYIKATEMRRLQAKYKLKLNRDLGLALVDPGIETDRIGVKPFFMDLKEVSNSQYADFLEANPETQKPKGWKTRSAPNKGLEAFPVVGVSFAEAGAYARWAGGKRLPNAAEWAMAASGPEKRRFPWGYYSELDIHRCNSRLASKEKLVPVEDYVDGELQGLSPFGIANLSGNAAEWATHTNSVETKKAFICGGSFRSHIFACQANSRVEEPVNTRRDDVGFRCVLDLVK
jgi:serine/threonine protein kinase